MNMSQTVTEMSSLSHEHEPDSNGNVVIKHLNMSQTVTEGGGVDRQLTADITWFTVYCLLVKTHLFVGIVLCLAQCWGSGSVGSICNRADPTL